MPKIVGGGMETHALNPRTKEVEAYGVLLVQGKLGLKSCWRTLTSSGAHLKFISALWKYPYLKQVII